MLRRHGCRTPGGPRSKKSKVTPRGRDGGKNAEKSEILTGRQRQIQSRKSLQSEESFVFPIILQRWEEEDEGRLGRGQQPQHHWRTARGEETRSFNAKSRRVGMKLKSRASGA